MGQEGRTAFTGAQLFSFFYQGLHELLSDKAKADKQSNGSLKQSTDPYFPQSLFPDSDNVFFATGQETGNAVKLFIT